MQRKSRKKTLKPHRRNNHHVIKNSYADQSDSRKGVQVKIGIIGAGFIARAVTAVAMKHGHEIMVSNTRGRETLFSLTGLHRLQGWFTAGGCRVRRYRAGRHTVEGLPGDSRGAARKKDRPRRQQLLPGAGRPFGELDRDEITTSELLARHLPKSKVVKGFNAIQAAHIESDGRPAGSPDRRAHPIAGDDAAATKEVADLVNQFGFEFVNAGPLAEGRRFQKGTPAYCVPMDSRKLQEALRHSLKE